LLILAASLAGASALSNLTKLAVARARPEDGLVDTIGYAFPSGHSTAAAAGWIALAFVVGATVATRRARLLILAAALLIIAIVGASRVYLGVHWSTDVLGGWALGGLWIGVVLVAVSGRGARLRS
jgi:undecaprenyl-diphosphatase